MQFHNFIRSFETNYVITGDTGYFEVIHGLFHEMHI